MLTMETEDNFNSVSSLISRNKKASSSKTKFCKCLLFFLICSVVVLLVVSNVILWKDVRNLKKRFDEDTNKSNHRVTSDNKIPRTNNKQGTEKDGKTELEKRVNETEDFLKSEIVSLRISMDGKLSNMREELVGKPDVIYINESLLGLKKDLDDLTYTTKNMTMLRNYSDVMVKDLTRVLHNAKHDLLRLEKDLSRLHANHSELGEAKDALDSLVKNLTKTLEARDKINAVTIKRLQTKVNTSHEQLVKILQILSRQNITFQAKIQDTTEYVISTFREKLDNLVNSTAMKMRAFNASIQHIQEDHKQAHDEFRYWNRSLDSILETKLSSLRLSLNKLDARIQQFKTKQESNKNDFDKQQKAIREDQSKTKEKFAQDLNNTASGLTKKISSNHNTLQSLEGVMATEKSKVWDKFNKLEARIKQLESKGSQSRNANIKNMMMSILACLSVSYHGLHNI